jgi:hypothetical protein
MCPVQFQSLQVSRAFVQEKKKYEILTNNLVLYYQKVSCRC